MGARRFPIHFGPAGRLMAIVGLLPRWCYLEVAADEVRVRFAWGFWTQIPRTSVVEAVAADRRLLGWGVHGWRGRWLVNGSMDRLVELTIDPPVRARVVVVPIRLRTLWVSVTDRDGFLAALGVDGSASRS